MHWPPKHVRARLTLWYAALLATVLLVSWGLVGLFLFFQLRSQVDHYAIQDIETVEGLAFFDPSGQSDCEKTIIITRNRNKCWNGSWKFVLQKGRFCIAMSASGTVAGLLHFPAKGWEATPPAPYVSRMELMYAR